MRKSLIIPVLLLGSMILSAGESLPLAGKIDSTAGAEKIYYAGKSGTLLRRRAFRYLLEVPGKEKAAVEAGLKDRDPVILSHSLQWYFIHYEKLSYGHLQRTAAQADPFTLNMIMTLAGKIKDEGERKKIILQAAANPHDCLAKRQAARMAGFSFFRINKRLKDDPTHDAEVVTVRSIPLARENWLFRTDPKFDGHRVGWFKKELKENKWTKIKIGYWEEQGFKDYDGIAWYRFKFRMPPAPAEMKAVELYFRGVDESAWVWLNGKYVGQHDLGPSGWDKPFHLDVTGEILWGKENVLAVRVEDTQYGGGIWRPVSVEILK